MKTLKRAMAEGWRKTKRKIPLFSYEERFRFRAVEEGKLYRASLPTPKALAYFRKTYGIAALVIVLRKLERYEYEVDFAGKNGITIHHIPLSHRSPTDEEVQKFFAFVDDPRNQPVLLHCYSGKDRTGCFALLWRVERLGCDVSKAWHEMRDLGHCAMPWEPILFSSFKKWLEKRYGTALERGGK
jgi:protein-tyrosine phosphatase